MELGAIIGGGEKEEVEALGIFGLKMGTAFQIVDDVICLTSREEVSGKPRGSDIRNGRPTFMAVHALQKAVGNDLDHLRSTLGNRNASESEVNRVVQFMQDNGSISYARRVAEEKLEEAKRELNHLRKSKAKDLLVLLANIAVMRHS